MLKSLFVKFFKPQKPSRLRAAADVFLIQALVFSTLWGVYNREGSAYLVFALLWISVLAVVLSVIYHWRGLGDYGIRFDNISEAFKRACYPLLFVIALCFAFAWLSGGGIHWPKWTRYLEFPLAGLLQQIIFQGYFYNRYYDIFRRRFWAVLFSAVTFMLFHLPNPGLMSVTFFTGLYAAYFFGRYRNIFILALLHGWISLALTMTLEPAGLIQDYKVGPAPMAPIKKEIRSHLTSDTKIGQFMPSRGITAKFSESFDRPVDSMDVPHHLDTFLASSQPVFVAADKMRFQSIAHELKSPHYIWDEYRVWLRKFPHRRSRTLKCVFTFNYSRLKKYYREDVLLISNRPRPRV